MMQNTCKKIETLAHEYSSEGTQRELSNEYQHDRVKMVIKHVCVLVLWTKVASALEGLMGTSTNVFLYSTNEGEFFKYFMKNAFF